MVRTQIQLTEDQSLSLQRLSIKHHKSIAELIRQAVEMLIRSTAKLS